jgi:putative YhdH/YhfP family quinone oxidoreductase
MASPYRALLVTEGRDGAFTRQVVMRDLGELPPNDTLIRVHYSSLNYKDALSATGNKGVTRNYPHTPGIDAAGEVVETADGAFKPGDPVIVTSYDLGMNTPGGFGDYIRVPAAWVVPLPAGLTLRESMIFGTAGFTAALCVNQLRQHGVTPDKGDVLVTGATGGVGCIAVAILAKLGYRAVAVTGKADALDWLAQLGAAQILPREEADDASGRPMLKERWAGVVDAVGGNILATAIKATKRDGCVTACGLTQSSELRTTVYPFILRGVTLQGVDSAETAMPLRREMWRKLADEWKPSADVLDAIAQSVPLDGLNDKIDAILHGQIRGRVVVRLTSDP